MTILNWFYLSQKWVSKIISTVMPYVEISYTLLVLYILIKIKSINFLALFYTFTRKFGLVAHIECNAPNLILQHKITMMAFPKKHYKTKWKVMQCKFPLKSIHSVSHTVHDHKGKISTIHTLSSFINYFSSSSSSFWLHIVKFKKK